MPLTRWATTVLAPPLVHVLIVLFGLAAVASPARAQPSEPPAEGATREPTEPANPLFELADHPRLNLPFGQINFRARVQFDRRDSDAAIAGDEELTTDIARRRVGVEGTLASVFDFQVEAELGQPADPWRDVYVDYTQFREVRVRYGKFKVPFGLDENTSATSNDFVSRSLAADLLSPGRDIGLMVHGQVIDRIVGYEVGVFRHDGRNARSRGGNRVEGSDARAARVTAVPFRGGNDIARELEVGVAWTSSALAEGETAVRGRTVLGQPFMPSSYLVNGRRRRLGVEARFRPGPVQVQAEYIRLLEDRLGQSVEDTDLSPLRARGWYVQGSWALTGESKADGLSSPRRPFPQGIGAVELAARLEQITFDSTGAGEAASTSPRAEVIVGNGNQVLTVGVNWYLNRWIKLQFNVVRETLTDPSRGPLPSQASFTSRILRFQFQL